MRQYKQYIIYGVVVFHVNTGCRLELYEVRGGGDDEDTESVSHIGVVCKEDGT